MAAEIRELVKVFEPDSFNDKFEWPFIFPLALKAASPSFCSQSNQSVHTVSTVRSWMCDVGLWNSDLMFIVCLGPNYTLPLGPICIANPLRGQLLLPFSFFMLNSNHYFQRKASPKLLYQVCVLGGSKAPVRHPAQVLHFIITLLFFNLEDWNQIANRKGKDFYLYFFLGEFANKASVSFTPLEDLDQFFSSVLLLYPRKNSLKIMWINESFAYLTRNLRLHLLLTVSHK